MDIVEIFVGLNVEEFGRKTPISSREESGNLKARCQKGWGYGKKEFIWNHNYLLLKKASKKK